MAPIRTLSAALLLAITLLPAATPLPALAADPGLVTEPSRHGARETVERFTAAVRQAGWTVFTEIDHAAAARTAGMALRPRSVILFGNPAAGTPAMQARPTLALDLPMRVLVWEDDQGRVFVTRSSGADVATRVFGRHGQPFPAEAQGNFDAFVGGLVAAAAN